MTFYWLGIAHVVSSEVSFQSCFCTC